MIGAMHTPKEPPNEQNVDEWRGCALAYLAEAFGEAAPARLENPVVFPRSPLEGEGATAAFEFTADRGGRGPERYYVFVGRTEPNYYPAYDLSAEEAFELHLGTRFMLVMGVAQVDGIEAGEGEPEPAEACDAAIGATGGSPARDGTGSKLPVAPVEETNPMPDQPYDPVQDARRIVDRVAPERPVSEVAVAATFDVDGQRHAVLRCRVGNEPVYVFGRDAPQGFSRRTNLPPHVAYRMHIGHVLRREAADQSAEGSSRDSENARERA